MKRLFAMSVAVFVCAVVGCGGPSTPASPSAPPSPTQLIAPAISSISAISPITGGTSGGTLVQIRGTGLRNTSSVTFGGVAATRVGWSPDGTGVFATTPPGKPGSVDVVLGQGGALINGFTYGPATPLLVTAVSPVVGSTAGGTYLTITGEGLLAGATVALGGADAILLYQLIGTSIDLTTRSHPAGRVDVVVTNPDGQVARLPGGYTYAPPSLSDFNGVWEGRVGHEEEGPIRVTVQDNVIVSVLCGTNVPVAPASTATGEFVVMENGRTQMTGGLVRADYAEGTINLAGCTRYETVWSANRR